MLPDKSGISLNCGHLRLPYSITKLIIRFRVSTGVPAIGLVQVMVTSEGRLVIIWLTVFAGTAQVPVSVPSHDTLADTPDEEIIVASLTEYVCVPSETINPVG